MNVAFEALLNHYVRELGKQGDFNTCFDLQSKMIYERAREVERQAEMEERIINNVLSRITTTVDVSQAVGEIKKIKDELNKL